MIGKDSDTNGKPIGQYDANTILKTQVYDVMLPDGPIEQYYTKLIGEDL